MQRSAFPILLVAFTLLLPAGGGAQIVLPANTGSRPEITASDLRYHLSWLASDALEGRGTGTAALDSASVYIAHEFQRYGLQPAGENGGWYQTFEVVTGVALGAGNSFRTSAGESKTWRVGTQVTPLSFSMNGSVDAHVVFAGYGITAPRRSHDDYGGIDVHGAIVLVASGFPDAASSDSSLAPWASLRSKALAAREAGAVALLVFNPDTSRLHDVHYDGTAAHAGIPVFSVCHEVVATLAAPGGIDPFALIREMTTSQQSHSMSLPDCSVALSSDVNFIRRNTRNVVGLLPGSDAGAAKRAFVVGAHYDHLGWGQDGSLYRGNVPMVHNGADDNGSGTASMLELAEWFGTHRPRHSLLFIAFTGEEMGLLGSGQWVKHPTLPIESIAAMFNIDMVGRLNDSTRRLNVQGTGTSPIWDSIAKAANPDASLDLALIPDGQGSSDHASFYMKDIPVLFFFTGLHTDYHRPSDDVDLINFPGQERVTRYIQRVISLTDTSTVKPGFVRVKVNENQRARGSSVYVGTIPDFGSTSEGFKISGTSPGSPAEKANMQAGDVIIEFGATKVISIYDYMNALALHKPGEDVPVKIKRGNDVITLTVHLVAKK